MNPTHNEIKRKIQRYRLIRLDYFEGVLKRRAGALRREQASARKAIKSLFDPLVIVQFHSGLVAKSVNAVDVASERLKRSSSQLRSCIRRLRIVRLAKQKLESEIWINLRESILCMEEIRFESR